MAVGRDSWTADFGKSAVGGRSPATKEAVIGAGCSVKGSVELEGRAQIDGIVEGEICSKGSLTIGESAVVKASIVGEQISIFGRVEGDVTCSERLEIHTGARLNGDILSPSVVMHDGVVFDGYCRMDEGTAGAAGDAQDEGVET